MGSHAASEFRVAPLRRGGRWRPAAGPGTLGPAAHALPPPRRRPRCMPAACRPRTRCLRRRAQNFSLTIVAAVAPALPPSLHAIRQGSSRMSLIDVRMPAALAAAMHRPIAPALIVIKHSNFSEYSSSSWMEGQMRTAVAARGAGRVGTAVERAAARKVHGRLPVLRLHPVAQSPRRRSSR